jgi:hypothetical protein
VGRAHEVAEENARGLSDTTVDVELWWEESKRGHQEQLEELTVLQTRGFELCFSIVGPPRVRNHLSEVMWIAALHHTKMAKELASLRMTMSFAVEFTLG